MPPERRYPTGLSPQRVLGVAPSGYNVISYNTKLVSKADAPKNWEDLCIRAGRQARDGRRRVFLACGDDQALGR